jgi:aubergine-like protein
MSHSSSLRERKTDFYSNQASFASFKGISGTEIELMSNYIRVTSVDPNVYQYEVKFNPDLDSYRLKRILLQQHEKRLGLSSSLEFDGMSLFVRNKLTLNEPVTTVNSSIPTTGEEVMITIKHTKDVPWKDCAKVFNLVIKNVLKKLNLVQVGRGIFDPQNRTEIRHHKLEVWPGYVTAIDQKEGGLLVNVQISHRVLRQETVLDVLMESRNRHGPEWKNRFLQQVIGESVLTRYNNKSYRVDDIDFETTPESSFQRSDGTNWSFIDYYLQQYQRPIRDRTQPMLIHRPKPEKNPKHARPRPEGPIMLVPELCFMTGLTDGQRENRT